MTTDRKEPELSLDTVKYLVISSDEELESILPVIESEPVISVDTETTGLDPYSSRVLLVQVGIPGMSYVVNCSKVDVKKLKPALESKTSLKLLQNAKFDYKMLKANFDISLCNIYCTMIAERLITVGYEYGNASLKVLSEKYAGIFLDKDIRKSFIDKETGDDFTPREIKYSALDAAVMFPIYEKQVVELEDRGLVEVALLELRVLPIVGDMELSGCLIDKEKWHNIVEEVRCRRDKVSKVILEKLSGAIPQKNIFGLPEINLDSQQQLLACLHKLKVKGKGGKLLENTSEESLSEAKDKHPVVKDILKYRGDEKIITAYGLRFLDKIHPKTGRLHADFNQLRAETGRFSSSNPNLQQIPGFDPNDPTGVDFRGCFAATPGYKMLCADYCVAPETRVLTVDLNWIQIKDVKVGQELVGIEEYPTSKSHNTRVLRPTTVEGITFLRQPTYKITLDDGSSVKSSELHRWLVQTCRRYDWLETGRVETGCKIASYAPRGLWGNNITFVEGYSAGVFSRDGNIPHAGTKTVVSIEFLGEQDVVGIQTSERTFIAEGLISHNSQQEIRVLADASDDPSFREAYINDVDIHKFTASRLFQCTLDEVTKQQRTIAKTINFLIIYGGGAFKLSRALEIPEDEAAGHIERYFKMYPLIRGFLNKVAADALKNRYSSTITGRKRYYEIPEKDDPEYSKIIARIRRQASNHFVQGCLHGDSMIITREGILPIRDTVGLRTEYWTGKEWKSGTTVYSGKKEVMELTFGYDPSSIKLKLTRDHKILTYGKSGEGWVRAGSLVVGEQAVLDGGSKLIHSPVTNTITTINSRNPKAYKVSYSIPVSGVSNIMEVADTYDVMLDEEPHCFVANGVVCHNSSSDITKQALIYVDDFVRDKSYDARILMCVHDEIVMECKAERAEEGARDLEDAMLRGFTHFFKKIPMKVDAIIGDCWSKG